MRAQDGVMVAMLLLVGCSSSPGESVSGAPSASPSASALASREPTASVHLVGSGPVLEASRFEGKDAILPAAFLMDNTTYHAFLVGFGPERGDQRPYYARSADGLTWSIADADPLAELGLDLFPPGPIPTSVLHEVDGSWTMYLWGATDPSGFRSSIWRATAADPAGPWIADPEPVLRRDPDGWDSLGVDSPSVARTEVGYAMAFVGASLQDRNTAHIGFATSEDGITWIKRPEPIIDPGHCGDYDNRSTTQPRLLYAIPGGFLLAYSGNGLTRNDAAIGLSTSVDGVTWTCAAPSPLLDRPDVPGSQGIHTIALGQGRDGRRLLIESLIGAGSELWLADLAGT